MKKKTSLFSVFRKCLPQVLKVSVTCSSFNITCNLTQSASLSRFCTSLHHLYGITGCKLQMRTILEFWNTDFLAHRKSFVGLKGHEYDTIAWTGVVSTNENKLSMEALSYFYCRSSQLRNDITIYDLPRFFRENKWHYLFWFCTALL